MKALKYSLVLHYISLLLQFHHIIIAINFFSSFHNIFLTALPTKFPKLGLAATVAPGEIDCLCLLRDS